MTQREASDTGRIAIEEMHAPYTSIQETVELGLGSRALAGRSDCGCVPRGLLPVPPAVDAEIALQETKYLMTAEYLKILRDRLTLEHYCANVEVAFRRNPKGIELIAAGLEEIAAFRSCSSSEERQGVIYGVG